MDGWEKNKKTQISHTVSEKKKEHGSMNPKNVKNRVFEKKYENHFKIKKKYKSQFFRLSYHFFVIWLIFYVIVGKMQKNTMITFVNL